MNISGRSDTVCRFSSAKIIYRISVLQAFWRKNVNALPILHTEGMWLDFSALLATILAISGVLPANTAQKRFCKLSTCSIGQS